MVAAAAAAERDVLIENKIKLYKSIFCVGIFIRYPYQEGTRKGRAHSTSSSN